MRTIRARPEMKLTIRRSTERERQRSHSSDPHSKSAGWLDRDDVVVKLDAWFVGDALNAADDAGVING